MHLTDVLRVLQALDVADVVHWIGGGWGVDALAGRQTREHRDLDLVVAAGDVTPCLHALRSLGYTVESDWLPVRVELAAEGRRWVDVHPVAFSDDGYGMQAGLDGTSFDYPPEGFGVGALDGRAVRCLTADQQRRFRTGYELRPSDLHDLERLSRVPDDPACTRFATLLGQTYVDYAHSYARFTTAPAPDRLVSRLHLVALTPERQILVCRSEQEWRFLPGGTREPGESIRELAERELMEEAGARLSSPLRYVGAHVADSGRVEPFRSHIPHPRTYWAYALVDIERVGPPSNPPDGERVVEVLALDPEQAATLLDEAHDSMHADVVRLACALGPGTRMHPW